MAGQRNDQIRRYIADRTNGVDVLDDEDLYANGHVTSLFAVQLVLWLQRTFNIRIERGDLDLDNFRSIQAIERFVDAKRAADVAAPTAAGGHG